MLSKFDDGLDQFPRNDDMQVDSRRLARNWGAKLSRDSVAITQSCGLGLTITKVLVELKRHLFQMDRYDSHEEHFGTNRPLLSSPEPDVNSL